MPVRSSRPRPSKATRPGTKANLKSPVSPGTRPPLLRMVRMHELIQSGKYPNCGDIAAEFEISTKTAQRDIDFMRDQWQLPLEYNALHRGFAYTAPVSQLPTMTVSQGELVALLVAQKALEQYRDTPFERPIARAFEKLAATMDAEQGISIHRLAEAFSFKPSSLAQSEMKNFSIVAEAVVQNRQLVFEYRALRAGATNENRRLEPYHLGCIADQWYVIGRDTARDGIRTFALPRMARLRLTKEIFERPADFSPTKVLGGSFAAFEARETETVRLRLSPLAARLAAERKWHPSQIMESHADGSADLLLTVGIAPDLENWILSWGEQAEVLSPDSLRQRIAQRHAAAARMHRTPAPQVAPLPAKAKSATKASPVGKKKKPLSSAKGSPKK